MKLLLFPGCEISEGLGLGEDNLCGCLCEVDEGTQGKRLKVWGVREGEATWWAPQTFSRPEASPEPRRDERPAMHKPMTLGSPGKMLRRYELLLGSAARSLLRRACSGGSGIGRVFWEGVGAVGCAGRRRRQGPGPGNPVALVLPRAPTRSSAAPPPLKRQDAGGTSPAGGQA